MAKNSKRIVYVAGNLLMEIENELPFTMKKYVVKKSIIGFQQPKNVLMLIESKKTT
jgi:hypothetical protein